LTYVRRNYSEIRDGILSRVTKGVVHERHEYTPGRTKHLLEEPGALEIVLVEGTRLGGPYTFKRGSDYQLENQMIGWIREGVKPDDHTSFFVNYRLRDSTGITDINPGSVVRTIVESIAREIDLLHAQMEMVYNSGFVDTANGTSLDLVVSLLGITRKPAGFATGEITFGRNLEPGTIEVVGETCLFDGKDNYVLKNKVIREIKKIEGPSSKKSVKFTSGTDFILSGNSIIWQINGKKPDTGENFQVDYTAFEEYRIPIDTRVSTFARRSGSTRIFRATTEMVLKPVTDGRWEADVPVVALDAGKQGNVFAGTVAVMPKPPVGIEYVINRKDILNGTDQEEDEELRVRAKHALETAGRATLSSLHGAVKNIEGITGEVMIVDQPDGVQGIVEVIASGGDETEIRRVIEETRSAGILVEFKRPKIIPLDIQMTMTPTSGAKPGEVQAVTEQAVRTLFGGLNIGEDVILSRIISTTLGVAGVRDVFNITINEKSSNVAIKSSEKGELRRLDIFLED